MIEKNTVFTIGRQFGSGGRVIGKTLAARLNIPFYDAELITSTAKISGLLEEAVKQFDERAPENRWHPYWFAPFHSNCEPMGQQIFNAQFEAVRQVADKGGAVIVGRCAEYVLRERKNVVSTFIQASDEARIARIKERYQGIGDKAETLMRRTDKARAWYYSFYTGKTWGAAESYDICVRADVIGINSVVDLIIAYAEALSNPQ